MKKIFLISVAVMGGIWAHLMWHPDIATGAISAVSAQIVQALSPLTALSLGSFSQIALPWSGPLSDSTVLALVIGGIATLVYVGYTSGGAFRERP